MKILLYGFKAYDRFEDNITEKIVKALPAMPGVTTKVFDVEFDREMFLRVFDRVKPDIIIGLGQHPRARRIRIERKARNEWKTRTMSSGKAIEGRGGPMPLSLRIARSKEMIATYDAGTYVCNYSMYLAEGYAREHNAKAAFLHIPRSLPIARGVSTLQRLLRTLLRR